MAAISASRSTADSSSGDKPPPPVAFTVNSVIRALPGAVFTRIVVWAPAPSSGVTVMVKLATASLQKKERSAVAGPGRIRQSGQRRHQHEHMHGRLHEHSMVDNKLTINLA